MVYTMLVAERRAALTEVGVKCYDFYPPLKPNANIRDDCGIKRLIIIIIKSIVPSRSIGCL